jgi:hypothetical protein
MDPPPGPNIEERRRRGTRPLYRELWRGAGAVAQKVGAITIVPRTIPEGKAVPKAELIAATA